MAFPGSFGPQVAAIMEVLAKAAVAEITKLVLEGTAVLRLEMGQRDERIQELKATVELLEAELCKAQQAAAGRRDRDTEDKVQQTDAKQDSNEDEMEGPETFAVYLEPKSADSVFRPQCEAVVSGDMTVKCEPAEEHSTLETTADYTAAARVDIHYEAAEPDGSLWHPPPACSLFENNSDEPEHKMQHHIQIFASHDEQRSHRNTECSFNAQSAAAEQTREDLIHEPGKVPLEIPPLRLGNTAPPSGHNEPFGHRVNTQQFLQSTSQQMVASLSSETFSAHTFVSNADDHILSRSNIRAKRLQCMWRTNQKQFNCSVCNKGFPRLSQLEAHKASHESFKPFRCLKCGKSFTQKTRLKTHQSVHTGERPFSCKICGKMFSRQDNCLRHERFHSGLKPYSCGQCGKSFTVLANLKIHQELHLRR